MYSIVDLKGEQCKVAAGDKIRLNMLQVKDEKELDLDKVLLFSDGKEISIGRPYVENARVKAQVISKGRDRKITVFKKKRRKDYRKKTGHRQAYVDLRITEIAMGNKKDVYKPVEPKKAKKQEKPKAQAKPLEKGKEKPKKQVKKSKKDK